MVKIHKRRGVGIVSVYHHDRFAVKTLGRKSILFYGSNLVKMIGGKFLAKLLGFRPAGGEDNRFLRSAGNKKNNMAAPPLKQNERYDQKDKQGGLRRDGKIRDEVEEGQSNNTIYDMGR